MGVLAAFAFVVASGAAAGASEGLSLAQGSVLGITAFEEIDTLLEYSPQGELLASLEITAP